MANNILQLFQDHITRPDVVKLMGEAYDLALEMAPDGTNHEVLARAIIAAAKGRRARSVSDRRRRPL